MGFLEVRKGGNIISASRRTDIPAFYSEWFINRLRQQYLYVRHPYSGRLMFVSLRPEDIAGIVFWSKDFSPLLSRIHLVERVTDRLFFHFTITAMRKEIEPATPPYAEAIKDLIFISKRYSPGHVVWRFDPICVTDRVSLEEHTEAFVRCAERLKGYVYTCYISFVHPYQKVMVNFQRYTSHRLLDVPVRERKEYVRRLSSLAGQYGMRLYACCNDYLLSEGVYKARCIDRDHLSSVWGVEMGYEPPAPTRRGCGCTKSVDIGAYDTCPHGCVYCYANTDRKKAMLAYRSHDPEADVLVDLPSSKALQ